MAQTDDVQVVQEPGGLDPYKINQRTDPSIADKASYIAVNSVNQYEFMDNAYYGSGGFRTGDYLIPYNREFHYSERKQLAAYKNFVRPIVRALIEPVFTEEAPRVLTDEAGNEIQNSMANEFLNDVDNDNTPMQSFTEDVITKARRHGVTFVLVDNFPEEEQPPTAAQAIESRILPYAVSKLAQEVDFWSTNEFGKLTEIAFAEDPIIINGNKVRRARKWTDSYSVMCELHSDPQSGKKTWAEVGVYVYHNLGRIPVVSIYSMKRRNKKDILVDPPLFDIARLNLTMWNKEAEVRDLERSQAFSLLVIQTDSVTSVTVGPKNAIVIPMDATIAPTYISPDANILKTLVDNNTNHREDLFRMAEQNGVYGIQSESSGVSLAWKFFAQESQLKKSSAMAAYCEKQIMDLFALWTGEEFVYTVDYPTDFQPGDRGQEIGIYKETLSLPGVPEALQKKLMEKVARLMLQDEDPDEVKEIVDAIYAEPKPVPAIPVVGLEETEEPEEPEEPEEE